jgi:hypothetical protein
MRRRSLPIVAAAALCGLLACTGTGDDNAATADAVATTGIVTTTSIVTTTNAVTTTGAVTTTSAAAPAGTAAPELCSYENTVVLGEIANPALDETSGLVASRANRDLIWAHNDGNRLPGLFALGPDGADLGFHPVEVAGAVDIEDIAMISGPNGDDVLLADIGDNTSERTSIRIYRFDEPDPAVIAPITDIEVLDFVYPDRPHNAEVLLVDEANQRIVIVTKEQGVVEGVPPDLGPTEPSLVFEGPLDAGGDRPTELSAAGTLDTPLFETRTTGEPPQFVSLLGIGGLPTGGDVSSDGTLIALRTYETIWIWPRPTGSTVAESLTADPCQAGVVREPQGEAVAFFGDSLITTSEGRNPDLVQLRP